MDWPTCVAHAQWTLSQKRLKGFFPVSSYLCNPSLMHYYSFNRPRRDGRLSWPCWFTHKVVTRQAVSLAHDRESSPARTGGLTTMLRQQWQHHHIYNGGGILKYDKHVENKLETFDVQVGGGSCPACSVTGVTHVVAFRQTARRWYRPGHVSIFTTTSNADAMSLSILYSCTWNYFKIKILL